MRSLCPGQDFRNLTVDYYQCRSCGTEVEIFSHEVKAKCHNCGNMVYKERMPSCIDWCPAARQCVGEQRWQELKGESCGESVEGGK